MTRLWGGVAAALLWLVLVGSAGATSAPINLKIKTTTFCLGPDDVAPSQDSLIYQNVFGHTLGPVYVGIWKSNPLGISWCDVDGNAPDHGLWEKREIIGYSLAADPPPLPDGSQYQCMLPGFPNYLCSISYQWLYSSTTGGRITTSFFPNKGGLGTTGDGVFAVGDPFPATHTVTAQAGDIAWTFYDWTENGVEVSTTPSFAVPLDGDHQLVANFHPTPCNVSVSSDPPWGGDASGGLFQINRGARVEASQAPHYYFLGWYENGVGVSYKASYGFLCQGDRSLVAKFEPISWTVSVSADPSDGGVFTGGGPYTEGTTVTVTATAQPGFTFNGWYEQGVKIPDAPADYTFEILSNRYLQARFDRDLNITVSRSSLTHFSALGGPKGGSFSFSATPLDGDNIATPTIVPYALDNPQRFRLLTPPMPKTPTPGGLAKITASYATTAGGQADHTFNVPAFGMSCYNIALQQRWGEPPDHCNNVRYGETIYSGVAKNTYGLEGLYCSSFIKDLMMQGSALLASPKACMIGGVKRFCNYAQFRPYNKKTGVKAHIDLVQVTTTKDGTRPVDGETVARDKSYQKIIPTSGVLVDVDGVGTGLKADDAGGRIKGYRLDWYAGTLTKRNSKGQEVSLCEGFRPIVSVAACSPSLSRCPGLELK